MSANSLNKNISIIILVLFAFVTSSVGYTDENKIYKYKDENGVTVFSATPPSDAKDLQEVHINEQSTLKPDEVKRKKKLQVDKHNAISTRIQSKLDKKQELLDEIKKTKKSISDKKEKLEKGIEPTASERQRLQNGNTKLNQSYFNRIKKMKKDIADEEEKLDELRQQLRSL